VKNKRESRVKENRDRIGNKSIAFGPEKLADALLEIPVIMVRPMVII